MPRKARYGLDFFSKDVFFYDEINMQKAIIYGGAEASTIFEIIQGKIYQTGHFYKFNDLSDDLIFLFKKDYHFDESRIRTAFDMLIKYDFFDKESFDKGYLTSVEIQKFYYQITKARREPYLDECWLLNEEQMKFIETPKKIRSKIKGDNTEIVKGIAVVDQSTTEQANSSVELSESTQSKSNTKSHSQTQSEKKKRETIKEKGDSPQVVIPSHYDGYLETMIKQGLIDVFDINNEKINNFLIKSRKNYISTKLYDAVRYTFNQLHKSKWTDVKGKLVVDKFSYFRKALLLNLDKAQNNEDFQNDPRPIEDKILGNLKLYKIKNQ